MSLALNELFDIYKQTCNVLAEQHCQSFEKVKAIFEDKENNPEIRITVYGIYNAGKSTLINALIGKEVAEMDDRPTTDKVNEYQWGKYTLCDSPGIDAPIKHQQITEGELLRSDVVIFVVNPLGVAEELYTLKKLIELVKANKKVFLVFNEKQHLDNESLVKIRDKIFSRLQQQANEFGIDDILEKIPVIKINAKRALNAKLNGDSKLVEKSNIINFENELSDFLNNFTTKDIVTRLSNELLHFYNDYERFLSEQTKGDLVKSYSELLALVKEQKGEIKKFIDYKLSSAKNSIERKAFNLIINNPDNPALEYDIPSLVENEINLISPDIESRFNNVIKYIGDKIGSLNDQFDKRKLETSHHINPSINLHNSKINPEPQNKNLVLEGIQMASNHIKSEHIVSGLELVKKTLPSLMKGIGIKTMGKWASMITSKLPYIGLAIQLGLEFFGEDPEVEQLRKEQEAQKRFVAQIKSISKDIANEFYNGLTKDLNTQSDEFFLELEKRINEPLAKCNILEDNNSKLRNEIAALKAKLNYACS